MNGIFIAFAVIVLLAPTSLLAPSFRWENLAGGYVESLTNNK